MTTVADGLFQYGGMPVGTSLLTNKMFSTPVKGRAWYVDGSAGTTGNGRSPKSAFDTMQKAFDHISNGDIIYAVGKVTEQLVTPVQVFDVTIVGCGNRPRHADAAPVGSNAATFTWAAPASPVAGQALCRVLQQGWRFVNILWAASAGCACIELVRNAASGNDERDASHAEIVGCRFAGVASTDSAIKFGATSFTEIVNNVFVHKNDFQNLATAIKEQSAGLQYRAQIDSNVFISNTNDIVLGGYFTHVTNNVMSLAPTACIVLSGGTGSSQVHGNYLPGTYVTGALYAEGTGDNWNGNYASTGVTAAVP